MLLITVLTIASNRTEVNSPTGSVLNFAEEIAIHSPHDFITIPCTIFPSAITHSSGP
jgi:hypothetical protein